MNRFRFDPDHDRAIREMRKGSIVKDDEPIRVLRERPGGREWGLSIHYRDPFLRRLWRMMFGGYR